MIESAEKETKRPRNASKETESEDAGGPRGGRRDESEKPEEEKNRR